MKTINSMPELLRYPFELCWHRSDGAAVIGWSYDQSGGVLREERLAEAFGRVNDRSSFIQVLQRLNGHFAAVIHRNDFHAAAVDHIRSIPVLYRRSNNGLDFLCDIGDAVTALNDEIFGPFTTGWCVPGNRTLSRELFQLKPGQFIVDDGTASRPEYYYRHESEQRNAIVREEQLNEGMEVIGRVFGRLADHLAALDDPQVLVPLSGGYDSRLILSMLRKAGVPRVTAFTYGLKNSHEVSIAREVAGRLDVEWHFVEYKTGLFREFFGNSWAQYSRANHFLSSLPHEQDFFALSSLSQHGILQDKFVALPGYCGDLLGGSVTADRPGSWDEKGLEEFIRKKHFGSQGPLEIQDHSGIGDKRSFYNAYQQYFIDNKVSKFIVNAVRVFEHFGGHWIMPLWDRELAEFFYALPTDQREKQSFYNDLLFSRVFGPLGIDIYKPGFDDNYPYRLRQRLGSFAPWLVTLKNLLTKGVRKDPNGLALLNRMIYDVLDPAPMSCPDEINVTHAIYFLQNLNK
jgi:asparagine synthase (glutamine-hydrolysing)